MVKRIAIAMAALMAVGLMVLAFGLLRQGEKLAKPSTGAAKPVLTAAFGNLVLGEPDGSLIYDMQSDNGRLILRIRGGGKGERVVVIDLASGAVLGSIALNNAK
jgi:hypothetical protein